ncbi:hypothetical protein BDB00DRAFT_943223 [Zychaea mexicana]|uniref:uncharacterized protein n=1 Tax=Zychaea mexicana TaxID=64656 RepID=UPI0022FE2E65|nr:uncharacterized protein BDB00DRAFT_943223 [Zychaea mexicana]KAI9482620.1 hypothetical protein BDB00DRAFT_943223 [Zychaea mexicana]
MPSVLFWNNHRSSNSPLAKLSSFFSSPTTIAPTSNKSKNKPSISLLSSSSSQQHQEGGIRSILAQPEYVKIHCDRSLFDEVLTRQQVDDDDALLWCLAKRLKKQQEEEQEHTQSICYGRAIRILIYYFRASHHHHQHPKYFKKCVNDVPEPCCLPFDVQETVIEIQHSAAAAAEAATNTTTGIPPPSSGNNKSMMLTTRSMSVSSCATSSSYASSTSSSCSHCGVEKRAMPVCARCKAQVYCSNKCRMAHQPIHQRECNSNKL